MRWIFAFIDKWLMIILLLVAFGLYKFFTAFDKPASYSFSLLTSKKQVQGNPKNNLEVLSNQILYKEGTFSTYVTIGKKQRENEKWTYEGSEFKLCICTIDGTILYSNECRTSDWDIEKALNTGSDQIQLEFGLDESKILGFIDQYKDQKLYFYITSDFYLEREESDLDKK